MPLQGHNVLRFIFMLALHMGCGQPRLITHDQVGALCWLSTALGHSRASELQGVRPGYPRLLDCGTSGKMGTQTADGCCAWVRSRM